MRPALIGSTATSLRARCVALLGLLAVPAMLVACTSPSDPEPSPSSPVTASQDASLKPDLSVAFLGDSMTLGVNACAEQGRCADASWSEGTERVNSVSAQLAAVTGTAPTVTNFAKEGYKAKDALNQLDAVVAANPDLVFLLVGANDACTTHLASVTDVATYRDEITSLLTGINQQLPAAETVVISVPDLNRLWELGSTQPEAVATWARSNGCDSLLANPTSTATQDVDRRESVRSAVAGYNAALEEVCGGLDRCHSDGGAFFDTQLDIADVSTIDYFHLSASGQQKLADIAFDTVSGRS